MYQILVLLFLILMRLDVKTPDIKKMLNFDFEGNRLSDFSDSITNGLLELR